MEARGWVWVCVCAVSAACSRTEGVGADSEAADGTPSSGIAVPPCERFAVALCGLGAECGPARPGALVFVGGMNFGDGPTCIARFSLACEAWLAGPCAATEAALVDCTKGLTCTEALRTLTSGARSACLGGEACDAAGCAPGLPCGDDTCQRGPGLGEDCAETTCDRLLGLQCFDGKCERTASAEGGERCSGGVGGTPVGCVPGTECKNQNDLGDGECIAYAADGETCSAWEGPPCLFPANCVEGRCVIQAPLDCEP